MTTRSIPERPVYRVFFLDFTGHIVRADVLDCRDDGEAIDKAHQIADGCSVELWDRARRVIVIPPKP